MMAILCVLLTVACGCDYRKGKIPNGLLLLMLLFGVGWRFGREGPGGLLCCLGQMLCIICVTYPFFKISALGAGDVKLFGVTAGFLPFQKLFSFLFVSMLVAAMISLCKLIKNKNLKERLRFFLCYLLEVAQSGRWLPYRQKPQEESRQGICMSGPVLAGVLLYLGGIY